MDCERCQIRKQCERYNKCVLDNYRICLLNSANCNEKINNLNITTSRHTVQPDEMMEEYISQLTADQEKSLSQVINEYLEDELERMK